MTRERLRVRFSGAVQGVGFRPFVYRLATEMGLPGWVLNSNGGLTVEVEGEPAELARFEQRLSDEKPAPAVVLGAESARLSLAGFTRFEILASDEEAGRTVSVLPDLATCPDCLRELRDPANRRYHYPFTNCTHCGPRYTIVLDIPYDRERTTMRTFVLCRDCRREYEDPLDRRFHAQPNACPVCGPKLSIPVEEAARAIGAGQDRRPEGHRWVPIAGGRPKFGCGRPAAAVEAPRREAVCPDDAFRRDDPAILRDVGRRGSVACVARCAYRTVAAPWPLSAQWRARALPKTWPCGRRSWG